MIIRDVAPSDYGEICALLVAAFGGVAEADLVEALRTAGDVELELIAEDCGQVAGHILLSVMEAPIRSLALAPLAVTPERQRSGIGACLVEEAHRRSRTLGYDAIFVLGEPAYYQRFGYDLAAAAGFDSPYSGPYFMALPLNGAMPAASGTLRHAAAFAALA